MFRKKIVSSEKVYQNNKLIMPLESSFHGRSNDAIFKSVLIIVFEYASNSSSNINGKIDASMLK